MLTILEILKEQEIKITSKASKEVTVVWAKKRNVAIFLVIAIDA